MPKIHNSQGKNFRVAPEHGTRSENATNARRRGHDAARAVLITVVLRGFFSTQTHHFCEIPEKDMSNSGPISDKLVRLVRTYIMENKEQTKEWEEEPEEPFPQDCCGQSCRPCVFDMHHDDVVRWAKECAKRIPQNG
ncbi:hypothetical protein ANCCAN_04574 [Ancylostoma caninum]|uniref:Oxidoreductase-like domain-containing protein n=1 Tax=Ancylostoma caninum TaxID=29170 RepID=A0A368GYB0_ANCCA|nr:hypothetical protein ANCCAN_04574 [Ancylostoma caninum]